MVQIDVSLWHTNRENIMKELLTSLHLAKKQIKETKLEKKGYNTYSNYHYFLPEQIEQLVFDACEKQGLFTKFDLIRNERGETGILTVFHIETQQNMAFTLATAIPEIKATNIAQQLGGCLTYTERYLKQTAFGISDNTIDFDSQKPQSKQQPQSNTTPTTSKPQPTTDRLKVTDWLSDAEYKKALESNNIEIISSVGKKYDGKTVVDGKVYGMKKEYRENLLAKYKELKATTKTK